MGRKPKKQGKTGGQMNSALAVVATVFVVAGIAAVAFLSAQTKPKQAATAPAAEPSAVTSTLDLGLTGILMANADSVTVLDRSGQAKRYGLPDFWSSPVSADVPAEGAVAANGSNAYLLSPEQTSGTRESYLSPDRRYVARLGAPKRDNAANIEVYQGHEAPQVIVLRDRKGKALSDAILLGWFGPRTLAFMAVATSSRGLYAAELNGTLRQVAVLPDDIVYAEARGGAVWYAAAVLGEGLESAPRGPSELHRVTPDGQDTLAARDELRVFEVAVPDGQSRVMYLTDDGQAFYLAVGDDKTRLALGKRRPMGFLPGGRLLLREGSDLVSYDLRSGQAVKLAGLPEGEVRIFVQP